MQISEAGVAAGDQALAGEFVTADLGDGGPARCLRA
jgi:hypothetical protein